MISIGLHIDQQITIVYSNLNVNPNSLPAVMITARLLYTVYLTHILFLHSIQNLRLCLLASAHAGPNPLRRSDEIVISLSPYQVMNLAMKWQQQAGKTIDLKYCWCIWWATCMRSSASKHGSNSPTRCIMATTIFPSFPSALATLSAAQAAAPLATLTMSPSTVARSLIQLIASLELTWTHTQNAAVCVLLE